MTLDVQGDLAALVREVRDFSTALPTKLNQAWADEGTRRLRDNVGGGSGTSYLRMRSGAARGRVQATWNAQGGALSASGPGMNVLEEGTASLPGGAIRPRNGKYLTFRLYRAGDGAQPSGPWVRVREVRIRARFMVRDAAVEALDTLGAHLDALLGAA